MKISPVNNYISPNRNTSFKGVIFFNDDKYTCTSGDKNPTQVYAKTHLYRPWQDESPETTDKARCIVKEKRDNFWAGCIWNNYIAIGEPYPFTAEDVKEWQANQNSFKEKNSDTAELISRELEGIKQENMVFSD